jgi:hypothetical protein
MVLGVEQLSNTNRVAPKHLGRNLGRIIACTENNDLGAGDLAQKALEIGVCRDQNEVVSSGVLENPTIALAGESISKRALRLREKVAQQQD